MVFPSGSHYRTTSHARIFLMSKTNEIVEKLATDRRAVHDGNPGPLPAGAKAIPNSVRPNSSHCHRPRIVILRSISKPQGGLRSSSAFAILPKLAATKNAPNKENIAAGRILTKAERASAMSEIVVIQIHDPTTIPITTLTFSDNHASPA